MGSGTKPLAVEDVSVMFAYLMRRSDGLIDLTIRWTPDSTVLGRVLVESLAADRDSGVPSTVAFGLMKGSRIYKYSSREGREAAEVQVWEQT